MRSFKAKIKDEQLLEQKLFKMYKRHCLSIWIVNNIGHWLDMVYLPPPQGEFCRPFFSLSPMSCKDFATCKPADNGSAKL